MKKTSPPPLSLLALAALLLCTQSTHAQTAPAPQRRQDDRAARLHRELPSELPDAMREFVERHSFDEPKFRRRQSQLQGVEPTQASQPKEVRVVYLVPSDKSVRPEYTVAVQNAILHLQAFFREQLGDSQTFSVHSPVVEVYKTTHPASYYSTGPNAGSGSFWSSVLADGFALTGGGFNDPNNRWVFYIDADTGCGQVVGGTSGVALLPANDLRGLTGGPFVPPCPNEPIFNFGVCRWVGGLGHELGHAFDLPHPPGCDQNDPVLCGDHPRNSLMYLGYASFPNTYLLPQDKSSLAATGFLSTFNLATPGASYCESMTAQTPNPIEQAGYFVRWNYKDFFLREPDDEGAAFWTAQIEQCGADAACVERMRVNTSGAFFVSIEFQETGFLIYRTYSAAYGNIAGQPVPLRREEFMPDARLIGQGVIVNRGDWQTLLENNKRAYFDQFVARPRFAAAYPASLSPADFVRTLDEKAQGVLSQAERDALAADLQAGRKSRAQVLRAVAEDADLAAREYNKAFVLMQYYGYLQRNPYDPPERTLNFEGFYFWLGKLNDHNGDFHAAEMVKSFIVSAEYRGRFGRP